MATVRARAPAVTPAPPGSREGAPGRATITAVIRRRPVLAFYALAFAISWAGILLVIGGPGAFPGPPEHVERLFLPVMLAWLAGPSVASLVMTGLVDGRAGYRALLTRMTRWRVGARWYAVALLTAPLAYVATSLALALTSPEFLPGLLTTSDKAALLLMSLGVRAARRRLQGGAGLDGVRRAGAVAAPRRPRDGAPRGRPVGRVALARAALGTRRCPTTPPGS